MTLSDFNDWLRHHETFFPGVSAWIEQQSDSQGILATWQAVLRRSCIDDAKLASGELYEQDRPPAFGRHAAAVKKLAAEMEFRRAEIRLPQANPAAFRSCQKCTRGLITIFLPTAELVAKAVRLLGKERGEKMLCCVACDCEAGLQAHWKEAFPFFDPATMRRASEGMRETARALVGAVADREPGEEGDDEP